MNGKNVQDFVVSGATLSGLTRERSFVRTPQHNNHQNKRRSLAFAANSIQHDKAKPAIEIYRPPSKLNLSISSLFVILLNGIDFSSKSYFQDIRSDGASLQNKLNVNAPEFTVSREHAQNTQPLGIFSPNAQFLQHSKSSGNIQQQMQLAAARRHAVQMANLSSPQAILVSHPLQLQQLNMGITNSSSHEVHMNVGHLLYI